MVAFLANGIVLLFVLVIAAIVGICKLIKDYSERKYWEKIAEEERAKDPEAWDKRHRELDAFIKELHEYNQKWCR